jgi:hypothetical protein
MKKDELDLIKSHMIIKSPEKINQEKKKLKLLIRKL